MSTAAAAPATTARAVELQDSLNRYVYHPLARRLARLLVPTGISPNAVSAVSGGLICTTAFLYWRIGWPAGVIAGFACHLLWHVVDGADGDLARMTGKSSTVGEFIDGAADYLGHIVLYIALAAILDDWIGGWAWALASVSGVSRILQSNHIESHRRSFLWRVYGIGWLKTSEEHGRSAFSGRGWFSRNSARVAHGYLALAAWLSPCSEAIDAKVEEAAADPARLEQVRHKIREASRDSFAVQKLLGPNPRTIMLGLSMIAGSPLWYFLIEAVALNGVLVASVGYHNRVDRRLLAALSAA